MNVTITFNTDNASFEDDFVAEIKSVLDQAKEALIDSDNNTNIKRLLKDYNGNRVGTVQIIQN